MVGDRSAAFVYDALGRRVQFADDRNASTRRYYYDGPNEIVEYDYDGASETSRAYYVHGISYVDERLMMYRHREYRASMPAPPQISGC